MKLMNSSLFCFLVTAILLTGSGNVDARKRNKYKSQGSSLKSKTKTNWSSSTFRDDDEPKPMISTEEHGYYVKRTYSPLDTKYGKATPLQSPPYLAIPIAWFSCADQCSIGNSVVINDKTSVLKEGFLCDDDCNGPYEPICGQTPREVAVFYNKCKLNVAKCRTHGLWMDLEYEECTRLYAKEVEYAERKFRTSPYFRSNATTTVDDDEGHDENKEGFEDDKKTRVYDEEARENGKEARGDKEASEDDKEVREDDKEMHEDEKEVNEDDKEVREDDKEVSEDDKEVREDDKEVRENDKEVSEDGKDRREDDTERYDDDKELHEENKERLTNDNERRENDKEQLNGDKEPREDDNERREEDKDGGEDSLDDSNDATLKVTVEALDEINHKIDDVVYQAETEGPKSYIDTSTMVNEIN